MKIIILLLIIIISIELISSMDYGKIDECFTILKPCDNCTYMNLSTVELPDQTVLIINKNMTRLSQKLFNYSFCNTSLFGVYQASYCGNEDNDYLCNKYPFEINQTGKELTLQQSLLFLGVLLILILFLIGGVYGMTKSIEGAWTILYICLGYLSLFCIFFISYLYSFNYLYDTIIISKIFWILWLVMAYGFLPFIFIISLYVINKGIQDNLEKEFLGQGYSKEEAHEMAKKRKR